MAAPVAAAVSQVTALTVVLEAPAAAAAVLEAFTAAEWAATAEEDIDRERR